MVIIIIDQPDTSVLVDFSFDIAFSFQGNQSINNRLVGSDLAGLLNFAQIRSSPIKAYVFPDKQVNSFLVSGKILIRHVLMGVELKCYHILVRNARIFREIERG